MPEQGKPASGCIFARKSNHVPPWFGIRFYPLLVMRTHKFLLPVLLLLLSVIGAPPGAKAQQQESWFLYMPADTAALPAWAKAMYGPDPNLFVVDAMYSAYYEAHPWEKNIHTQNYRHWRRRAEQHLNAEGYIRLPSQAEEALKLRSLSAAYAARQSQRAGAWTSIGPFETYSFDSEGGEAVSWQANVYCIDQSRSQPDVLYAGTEGGGVFKTLNRGLDWTLASASAPFSQGVTDVKIHPANPAIVYATANRRIYKTTDGGANWNEVFFLNDDAFQLFIHASRPDTVFCAANNGMYRSLNGGQSWTQVWTGKCWDIGGHPLNSQVIYALRNNNSAKRAEFYKSTDGGLSWTIKSSGWYSPAVLADAQDIGARLAVTPAAPDMVYVALLGQSKAGDNGWIGVYRSLNAGESWLNPKLPDGGPYNTQTHPNLASINPNGSGFHQGFYNFALAVSASNPAKVWVGCLSLSESADSAKTWQRIGSYYSQRHDWVHPDIQDLHVQGNDIWVASDGGIDYSNDQLQTHVSRKKGIVGSDFWGFSSGWNDDVLSGGRYHNGNTGYYQTYGTGRHLRLGGAEAPTGYVDPLFNRTIAFSDIATQTLPLSISGPKTSSGSFSRYPNEAYTQSYSSEVETDPRYSKHLYLGEGSGFWKSSDGGNTFRLLHDFGPGARVLEIEVSRSNPLVMYCVLQPASGYWTACELRKSVNGGQSWTALAQVPASNRWRLEISLNPENAQELWVIAVSGANGQKVFQTLNGGASWINRTTAALNGHTPREILYQAGSAGVVYLATDAAVFNWDGAIWQPFSSGLPALIHPYEMRPFFRDSKLRLSSYGRGLWESPLAVDSRPLAQPMTGTDSVYCSRDTVQFDCYSILNHSGASWQWQFSPQPQFVSSLSTRNPKVVFGANGAYDVRLIIQDQHGTRDTATLAGMVKVENRCQADSVPGLSASFQQVGDYVQTPAINLNTNTFTLTAWVKPDGIQPDYAAVAMSDGDAAGLNFREGNNTLGYHWPGGAWWWDSNLIVNPGEWSYVAMVVSPSGITLYVNGKSATHSFSAAPTLIGAMKIGSYKGWTSRNFKGEIDEVCMWNRALSQAEIRLLRHLTRERALQSDPSLIAYYQFNESGSAVLDKAGTRHANLVSQASRLRSTAPVGGGRSHRLSVSAGGNYPFGATGASMLFPGTGPYPNGELVVSRIHLLPDSVPSSNPGINCYWIVNNYGNNFNFNALNALRLIPTGTLSPAILANPALAQLSRRSDNAHLNAWQNLCTASSVNGVALSFSSGCNLTQFGQFYIYSTQASTAILPIDQYAFKAQYLGATGSVSLTWTAPEPDAVYTIEHHARGMNGFSPIYTWQPGGATAWIHQQPAPGRNLYRLQVSALDGSSRYAATQEIWTPEGPFFSLSPNPVSQAGELRFKTTQVGRLRLSLYSPDGRLAREFLMEGPADMPIPIESLPQGVYVYQLRSAQTMRQGRLVIW